MVSGSRHENRPCNRISTERQRDRTRQSQRYGVTREIADTIYYPLQIRLRGKQGRIDRPDCTRTANPRPLAVPGPGGAGRGRTGGPGRVDVPLSFDLTPPPRARERVTRYPLTVSLSITRSPLVRPSQAAQSSGLIQSQTAPGPKPSQTRSKD